MNNFRTLSDFIDPAVAKDHVEKWIQARRHIPEAHAASLLDVKTKRLEVIQGTPTFFYRVVHVGTDEEAVFRVQGMLVSGAFPPFEPANPDALTTKDLRFTYQHAGIVGFDGESFRSQLNKLFELHLLFHRSSSRIHLKPYSPAQFLNMDELVCKSRLFTTGKDASILAPVPIPPAIDPEQVMQKLRGRPDVEFTEENLVSYRALDTDEDDGTRSYVDIKPYALHPGDIVELEFTVLAVPISPGNTAEKSHLFLPVLRGLTRLDDSLSISAHMAELRAASKLTAVVNTPRLAVKRKTGYNKEDEDTADTRQKVAKMTVTPMVTDRYIPHFYLLDLYATGCPIMQAMQAEIAKVIERHSTQGTREEGIRLSDLINNPFPLADSLCVMEDGGKGSWRLVEMKEGDSHIAKFLMVGRLCKLKGYPFEDDRPHTVRKRAPFLFQRAQIDGHHATSYETALTGLDIIRRLFEIELGKGAIVVSNRTHGDYQVSTRKAYLSKREWHREEKEIRLTEQEDPHGMLMGIVGGSSYIRTSSDLVSLYTAVGEPTGILREVLWEEVRINDIVELTVSFEAVGSLVEGYILETKLESVCILEQGDPSKLVENTRVPRMLQDLTMDERRVIEERARLLQATV